MPPTVGKFSRPAAAGRPAARTSRFAGVQAAQARPQLLPEGVYRLEVISHEFGMNPNTRAESYKSYFRIREVIEGGEGCFDREGKLKPDTYIVPVSLSGKGADFGMRRVKSMIMAEAGYEDEEAYNEFDPEGWYIEAAAGESNDFSTQAAELPGRLVDCEVTRGKLTADGQDYYREYAWGVVQQ